ncbi:DUF3846 domain-containing protein [Agrobacterium sp. ICMP 6402]|nr:DUF3846 domain-containing protein [Agrobacterium sp. ICMP 6402]
MEGLDMTKAATVYLLDPEAGTIQTVEIDARSAFAQTYTLIGCELVQVVPFDSHHVLVIDEDGLQDGLTSFTIADGYPQPLAGKIVLVGAHNGERFTPLQITIEDAAKRFTVCKPVLDPVFASIDETTMKGVILAGFLTGLQTRITRTMPTVMAGVKK